MLYLDNAATTPVSVETLEFFNESVGRYYANQEAGHYFAYEIRKALAEAEATVSRSLTGTGDNRVFWVGSGTEAFHVTLGYPAILKGNVVTTEVEHPAVLKTLAKHQAEVRYCKLLNNGRVDLGNLRKQLDSSTALVIIHHVQSELGSTQDLCEIRNCLDALAPQAVFMADTVQSAGKLAIPWAEARIDFAFCAGHKIGAPGGGCIVCREQGNQKFVKYFLDLRANHYELGRIDPALALTLAHQVEQLSSAMKENSRKAEALNQTLRNELDGYSLKNRKTIRCNIPASLASPYIFSFLIPGFQSAVVVRALSKQGTHISAGSACEAESPEPSRAMRAVGCSHQDAYSGLRVSLWLNHTQDDIFTFCNALKKVLTDY